MRYHFHLFVCANQKPEGKKCCTEAFGTEAVNQLRLKIKEAGLSSKIRVQKSGCLDVCAYGPALAIYPEGTFYGNLNLEMLDKIVDEHMKKGQIIQDHVLED